MQALAQWLHMGGQGLYVWGSVGMTLGLMAWEALALWRRAHASARPVREPGP